MSDHKQVSSSYFVENNTRYVFIDGNVCKFIDQCYATLKQQLSLPDYFGNNLDALEEVLSDLDWINEEKIKIIILNSNELLTKDISKKKDLLEIFNSSENKKLEIIYLDKKINTK
ncbi:MAG TPA: barstar family protein [Hanamia sp.]|nr:barstar family protein [Hanamia sp.]